MFYTTALLPEHVPESVQEGQPVVLQGGEYAMFRYEGPISAFQDFILMLYSTCLPLLKMTRRKGYDIERFSPRGDQSTRPPKEVACDYLIPIRR